MQIVPETQQTAWQRAAGIAVENRIWCTEQCASAGQTHLRGRRRPAQRHWTCLRTVPTQAPAAFWCATKVSASPIRRHVRRCTSARGPTSLHPARRRRPCKDTARAAPAPEGGVRNQSESSARGLSHCCRRPCQQEERPGSMAVSASGPPPASFVRLAGLNAPGKAFAICKVLPPTAWNGSNGSGRADARSAAAAASGSGGRKNSLAWRCESQQPQQPQQRRCSPHSPGICARARAFCAPRVLPLLPRRAPRASQGLKHIVLQLRPSARQFRRRQ